jgi:hypothetical protein
VSHGAVLGDLELAGVGPLKAVFTGFLAQSAGVFTIYIGQGTSPLFDVRFFAAALWRDREDIVEIAPRRFDIGADLFFGWFPLRGQPAGPVPNASVRTVAETEAGLHVLEVVATDQDARGIYLLGLKESATGLEVDGMLLATEAAYYSRCSDYIVPENAIALAYADKPFAATVWLEPSFRVHADGGYPAAVRGGRVAEMLSPTQATICWRTGQGFRIERDGQLRGAEGPPLFVVISDDGRISTVQAAR